MPQEFRVLKCFKCSIYQVDIVKKANKWQCKLCGEKQSVQKEFANGSAKECRIRAQKLNEKHIPEEHLVFKVAQIASQQRTTDISDNSKEDSSCVSSGSKWESFVDKTQDDNDENVDESDNLFETIPRSSKFSTKLQSNNTKKPKTDSAKKEKHLKLPQKRKFNAEESPLQVKNTFQSAKDYKDSSCTSSGNKWENFVDKTTEDDEENDDWFDKAMSQEIDNSHPISKRLTNFDTQTGNITNIKTSTYRSPKLSKRPQLSQTLKLTIEEPSSSTTNTFQSAKDLKVGLNDKPTSSSKWSKFTVDENVE